ncbi:site-specific integrase [Fusobacterium sp.]|uniref:Site-specific integrase n=1 Tax=Fusobacterium nucleatum TaxID=851 RepID=A0A323U0Z6_FUSNU|nr:MULTISPECIES: site-specific integrase [Fusobacterium]PCR84056.1 site-specific integrase [Fusobacterium nucleatum]PZA05090.1 site-specific integrase [Fusobacterium nucleatum]QJX51693.1 site-specific integrase [Fusobacterium nucleatum]HCE32557.1 site-specific integrase [Fusobacterium sp.]
MKPKVKFNYRLRDRNGIYHVVVYWINPITKEQESKSKSTGLRLKGNKKKAEEIGETFLQEVKEKYNNAYQKEEIEKNFEKKEKIKFLNFLEQSIINNKNSIEYTTYKSYRDQQKIIERFFSVKNLDLENVTVADILDFYNYLSNVRKNTNNTVIHYHALLRKTFTEAYIRKLIKENIMLEIPRPKKEKYISEVFNLKEINIFLNHIKGHRFELEMNLALFYGFRRSELLGLRFSVIDFDNNTILVNTKITSSEKEKLVPKQKMKNDSSYRIMPLLDSVKKLIIQRMERIKKDKYFFKSVYTKKWEGFICVVENGELIKPGRLTRTFRKLINECGLKKIRLHDLRHSCATLLYEQDIQLKDIQMWLGHSDIQTTANIYSHFDYTRKEKTGKIIEKSLKKL